MQPNNPKFVVGAFIFNDANQLFLRTTPSQQNKYTCINSKVAWGDTIADTISKAVTEKTNLVVSSYELIGLTDGLNIQNQETGENMHFIFADYKVFVTNTEHFTSNDPSRTYEWLTPAEWLQKNDDLFGPYIKEIIVKVN